MPTRTVSIDFELAHARSIALAYEGATLALREALRSEANAIALALASRIAYGPNAPASAASIAYTYANRQGAPRYLDELTTRHDATDAWRWVVAFLDDPTDATLRAMRNARTKSIVPA